MTFRLNSGDRYRDLKDSLRCWVQTLESLPERPLPAKEVAGTLKVLIEAADKGGSNA